MKITRTFRDYRSATLWCYDRGFSAPVMKETPDGGWTVELTGDDAKRAIALDVRADVVRTEAVS